jgi:hypothetical protein
MATKLKIPQLFKIYVNIGSRVSSDFFSTKFVRILAIATLILPSWFAHENGGF